MTELSLTKALFYDVKRKTISFTRASNLVMEEEREEDSPISNGKSDETKLVANTADLRTVDILTRQRKALRTLAGNDIFFWFTNVSLESGEEARTFNPSIQEAERVRLLS